MLMNGKNKMLSGRIKITTTILSAISGNPRFIPRIERYPNQKYTIIIAGIVRQFFIKCILSWAEDLISLKLSSREIKL